LLGDLSWTPMPDRFTARLLRSAALAAVLALATAGCTTTGSTDITGSISSSRQPVSDAEWRRVADAWGQRYRADPKDPQAAIHYAQALRATEQRDQAEAVLERASIENPHDKQVLGAYGRALADVGRYEQALAVLSRAHTPDQPDWRILNVQGAVLDQLGRHAEARHHYSNALKIKPDDPSVLSNLGLSYALTNNLKVAEQILRKAAAQPSATTKVRQNLALIIAMQGRMDEAERIVRTDVPPAEADANVAYLRQMLAQRKEWQGKGGQPQSASAKRKLSAN
jgi:Flp pilus assembly protein TadD